MGSGVPKQVQESLNACSIAVHLSCSESGLGTPLNAFHGQMGCIYLFEDILSTGGSMPSSSIFLLNASMSAGAA